LVVLEAVTKDVVEVAVVAEVVVVVAAELVMAAAAMESACQGRWSAEVVVVAV
jgi:hypothetical protein